MTFRIKYSPCCQFNDIRAVSVIFNMLVQLYIQIHNQDSEYKQILVKKNVKQEIEVMVKENCYFVKHQQHGVNSVHS
jgi:adenine C2-methylase RlmN of 23S rRNA A2503 and tRNA A37